MFNIYGNEYRDKLIESVIVLLVGDYYKDTQILTRMLHNKFGIICNLQYSVKDRVYVPFIRTIDFNPNRGDIDKVNDNTSKLTKICTEHLSSIFGMNDKYDASNVLIVVGVCYICNYIYKKVTHTEVDLNTFIQYNDYEKDVLKLFTEVDTSKEHIKLIDKFCKENKRLCKLISQLYSADFDIFDDWN